MGGWDWGVACNMHLHEVCIYIIRPAAFSTNKPGRYPFHQSLYLHNTSAPWRRDMSYGRVQVFFLGEADDVELTFLARGMLKKQPKSFRFIPLLGIPPLVLRFFIMIFLTEVCRHLFLIEVKSVIAT